MKTPQRIAHSMDRKAWPTTKENRLQRRSRVKRTHVRGWAAGGDGGGSRLRNSPPAELHKAASQNKLA